MCQRQFPVVIHGHTYHIACTLPDGHQCPCEGVVHEFGAPMLYRGGSIPEHIRHPPHPAPA